MRLHETVDRPNLMVKIPATKPGLAAIEDVIAKGRSINVTLIFSLRRYAEVAESYVRGLERLVAAGGDPAQGGVGGELLRLAHRHRGRPAPGRARRTTTHLKGRLAVANARLAYQHYQPVFRGPRWEFLAGKGATPQRVLWASTSTKNPAYPDTLYVEELIGPDTVNTMPEETIDAYQDHGRPQVRLEEGLAEARSAARGARRARASTTTTSPTRSSARACRSSRTPSRSCSRRWPRSSRRWPWPDAAGRRQAAPRRESF